MRRVGRSTGSANAERRNLERAARRMKKNPSVRISWAGVTGRPKRASTNKGKNMAKRRRPLAGAALAARKKRLSKLARRRYRKNPRRSSRRRYRRNPPISVATLMKLGGHTKAEATALRKSFLSGETTASEMKAELDLGPQKKPKPKPRAKPAAKPRAKPAAKGGKLTKAQRSEAAKKAAKTRKRNAKKGGVSTATRTKTTKPKPRNKRRNVIFRRVLRRRLPKRRALYTKNPGNSLIVMAKWALTNALPVIGGLYVSRFAANYLTGIVTPDAVAKPETKAAAGVAPVAPGGFDVIGKTLGEFTRPLMAGLVFVGLNFATKKVLQKHRTGIMVGASVSLVEAVLKAVVPPDIQSKYLPMGEFDSNDRQRNGGDYGYYSPIGTGEYVETGEYITTGEYVEREDMYLSGDNDGGIFAGSSLSDPSMQDRSS